MFIVALARKHGVLSVDVITVLKLMLGVAAEQDTLQRHVHALFVLWEFSARIRRFGDVGIICGLL